MFYLSTSKSKNAFTIPELLVTMTIAAILATIWWISFSGYTAQSRDTVRLTDLKSISKVLGLQKMDKWFYPSATNAVDVTYSWAVVWSQGEFWQQSALETGKIFWELEDPKYGNKYTYSVTWNKKEYQLGAYFEKRENRDALFSFSSDYFSTPSAYAAWEFNPLDLSPKIWLDATDVDGDGNSWNNPSDGSNISSWNNKSSLWSINNPTLTDGNLTYSTNWYENYTHGWRLPGVFIGNNRGLRLNNSEIDNGSIFYVVQKYDPFGWNDTNGLGLYWVNNSNYYFGYNTSNRVYAIRLWNSPNYSGVTWWSHLPFMFELLVNNGSLEYFNAWNRIWNGYTNSLSSVTWWFNKAGSSNRTSDLIVSEILIFDYDLSNDQREMVEWYLAHKWWYESVLPSDHPYKTTPPESIAPPTPDSTPDSFTIDDVSNANPLEAYFSNPFSVTGINMPVEISISGGEYSIDWGSYTSQTWTVSQGSAIRVKLTSSWESLGSVSANITIGWVSESYVVTTKSIDDTIDDFNFTPITDAQRNSLYISETKQISWINVPLTISITGPWAEYKITDGIPTDVTWAWVASGYSQNSWNAASFAFDDDLSTWWGSSNTSFPIVLLYDLGAWNAKNVNAYTLYRSTSQNGWNNNKYSPKSWSFQWSNNGSTWITLDSQSNETIATGASARTFEFSNSQFFRYYRLSISESVNSNRVNISEMSLLNIGQWVYTNSAWNIQQWDYVVVRVRSSSEYASEAQAVLRIWESDKIFSVITENAPADYDPDVFSFNPELNASPNTQYISNAINISWITAATSISISGWEYEVNNFWTWSSASNANLIEDWDTISVRGISHPTWWQTRSVNLTVGSQTASYNITTLVDNTPDTIEFADKTLVQVNSQIQSDSINITGINTQIPITNVTGGEYSINGWTWWNTNGQLENNDVLTLRVNSSSNFNSTTSMSVNIAGQSYSFNTTTQQADITPDDFNFLDIIDADLSVSYISEAIQVTDINSPTAISIDVWEYRIWNGPFTSDPGFVENDDEVSVRLTSANTPNETTRSQITIWSVSDYFEIETKEVIVPKNESTVPESNVYVTGDYNGLIAYAYTGATHYVLTTPSIMAYDLSSPNFSDIISEKKLVYNWFNNIPETYKDSNLTMSWWFDFSMTTPVIFEGTKEDLGSYSGLKEVDIWIRSVYNNFPWYAYIAKYLDTFSLTYLERILGESIGINPIKPYYCSDILRTKLVYNIAKSANIVADTASYGEQDGINNGIISSESGLDPEYISEDGNAWVDFSWKTPQKIGYIRIYNTIAWNSEGLSDAVITFYNAFGWIIDTHNIGFDTSWDYVIDLDFESIGKIYYAQKVRIQTTGGRKLSLREVEIYLWGDLESGTYRVDKDGLWGLSPYNVYCDMETDGWGWTRIGDNFITNGKFLRGTHTPEYTNNDPLDNIIIDGTTKLPPVYAADAYVLRHQWGVNQYYELSFDNIPGKYYAQEIRLWAWVDGANSSIFSYSLDYETQWDISSIAEFEVTQVDGTWKYVEARIPLDDVVDNFTWKLAEWIAGPIYITDLNMEVYYK